VLDPVGHGINEWKDGNKTKKIRDPMVGSRLYYYYFFLLWGFMGLGINSK
jgi:hypothetical protein